ncbi:MAG: hypothetical protein NZ602_11280 [Thermoguttaceae bacterium]|nr:hypothetical protein [Thermoguttaceae bacterium]MDW8037555.1 type ISP restriction/modification enzyme [Thermoguttaceae bacterium]
MVGKKTCFRAYLKKLAEVIQAGDAREESFYGALADLIQEVAQATGRPEMQVTVLPRPTEAGNPDFRVWDGRSRIVGYLEAKPPDQLLDRLEESEQLQRYRETFPNLILTNFLEFRLYRQGQRVAVAQLGRPFVLTELRQAPPVENVDAVWELLDQFLGFSLPKPLSAENLAVELAKRTRFLREIVQQQLVEEAAANRLAEPSASGHASLLGFYEAFQKYLIGALSREEFADLYAQTVTYGLFAAMAELGRRLVDLHLLHSAELDPPAARFEGGGNNRVEKGKHGLRYDAQTQQVWINQTQYFAPIPIEVWEYPIGGYQVAAKWLKDRQDRPLSLDEIRTYCRIVTALGRTIAIQQELDALYTRVEEAVLPLEMHASP